MDSSNSLHRNINEDARKAINTATYQEKNVTKDFSKHIETFWQAKSTWSVRKFLSFFGLVFSSDVASLKEEMNTLSEKYRQVLESVTTLKEMHHKEKEMCHKEIEDANSRNIKLKEDLEDAKELEKVFKILTAELERLKDARTNKATPNTLASIDHEKLKTDLTCLAHKSLGLANFQRLLNSLDSTRFDKWDCIEFEIRMLLGQIIVLVGKLTGEMP